MSKQKKKKQDTYKGYYPDEVKCGGKGGYGNSDRRNNSSRKSNGNRKNNFTGGSEPIKTKRNDYTDSSYVRESFNNHDGRENTKPAKPEVKEANNKRPMERTYKLPEVKVEDGKTLLPIEFSRFGFSTIKLLTLGVESLIVMDGKFIGPKTALVINDRDPEKGFKAAVVLNVGDYVVITRKHTGIDDVVLDSKVYKVVETTERPDADTKLGYAVVEEVETLTDEIKAELESALNKVADVNYVYAKPKTKKVEKSNE